MLKLNGYCPLNEEAMEYVWMAYGVCMSQTGLLVQHGHNKASLPWFVGVYVKAADNNTDIDSDTPTCFLEKRVTPTSNPQNPTWVDWNTSWHLWQFDLREMPCFIERQPLHVDVVQQLEKQ